jgi:serine-type D-Ala-D-Ala carboxypeptidase (penicillin-binding protein 5/6)
MRVSGRLAAVVTGLLAAIMSAALLGVPAAQAAVRAPQAASASPPSGPAGVRAPWAELENAITGSVLWGRDPLTQRPMGSITKVMTAYIVIEAGGLNRVLTVPKGIIAYDKKYDASTAGLVPGEKLTVLQLLYAMLIPSGCDAAYTLAYAYGPGRDKFIATMNATARRLGLTRTHFSDFSGLPDPGEYTTYSTASDLIKLGLDAMKLPLFRQIVALQSYHLAAGDGHRAHTWKTTNLLLKAYRGALGIKTGDTNAAGFCLLFEARRNGKTLIGVVLHSSTVSLNSTVSDAEKMLNWGFSQKG